MKVLPQYLFMVGTCLLLFVGCSTQKTKWINVHYHNLNCHYNVWWNGNESLKQGLKDLEEKAEDDYTQVLPVYQLGTRDQALQTKAKFDVAIEKGLKGIKKHSIYQKGKEWVPYVKNCYLLTAYGSFYEQDYTSTENTCHLIINQFGNTAEGDEAKILLARSFTCQKQYAEAEAALEELAREAEAGNLSRGLKGSLYMAMMECCLPQNKYKKTVQYLRLALDEVKDRKTRARLYFIMAQIYQKLDKRATASKYYGRVISMKPTYIMEFNARISQAACSDMNNADVEALVKSLDKMLRDKKNEEYKDQIYYAKGDMYLGIKDAQKACDNYKLAVSAAKPQSAMKAKAALKMADVLYDVYENYDAAQCYYDTAMRVITMEYPNYDEIRERHYLLTTLTSFTRTISANDSLLAVADMDSLSRDSYIRQKIEEMKQREEEEKEQAMLKQLNEEQLAQFKSLEGDWYFYNSRSVQQGRESFRRKWGNRLLEDYWFLSKKSPAMMSQMITVFGNNALAEMELPEDSLSTDSASSASTAIMGAAEHGTLGNPSDPYSIAYYLKGLPSTQAQRDSMHYQTAACLLNAGYIYNDGIKNVPRSMECYHRMTTEFSDDPNIVQAFYQLYRIFSKQGNTPQANYYRDMVLMGFPDGDYANLIRDDEYYKEIIKRSERAQNDYESVYRAYRRGRYDDVLSGVSRALSLYQEESLVGKFRYWKGMALLAGNERDSAKATFLGIVTRYPDTSQIVELARAQLDYIDKGGMVSPEDILAEDEIRAKQRYDDAMRPARLEDRQTTTGSEPELPAESQVYRYRESMQHYVIIIVDDKKIAATQLQYKIGDFNLANYANSGYRASPMMFTESTQLITIHRFKNAEEAMRYYRHIQLEGGPLSSFDPKDYTVFAISTQNYTTFYNRKNVEAYNAFFQRYYRPDEGK
ncbi:MAG: hypothetical protein SPJ13_01120 [Bacteroidales bacterium]|nr:hypothetical protein [Bacteroidales bacterium]